MINKNGFDEVTPLLSDPSAATVGMKQSSCWAGGFLTQPGGTDSIPHCSLVLPSWDGVHIISNLQWSDNAVAID